MTTTAWQRSSPAGSDASGCSSTETWHDMSGVVGRGHRQPERALLRRGVQLDERPDLAVAGAHPRWLRAAAGILAVFWGVFFFGIVDLLAFLQGEEFHDTILLSTG